MRVFFRRTESGFRVLSFAGSAVSTKRPPARKSQVDLVGLRVGRLVAHAKSTGGMWTWRCDCGNFKRLAPHHVRRGYKSCGCLHRGIRENLTGKRFGLLTVLQVVDRDVGRGQRRWLVRCDCGNEPIVAAKSLKSGTTRSCGCLRQSRSKETSAALRRHANGRYLSVAA